LLDVDADGDLTYNGVKVIEEVKEKTDLITTTGTGTKFLCDDGTYKQPTGNIDLSDYYTKTETNTKLNDYYLKTEVDTKLGDYYTKDDTNTKLTDYIKKTDLTTKFADYYTKTQIDGITGDLGTLTVTGASDLVSALNIIDQKFMQSISFSGKVLTLVYKNGATFNIDVSSVITDTSIGELKDVDLSNLTDGKILKYDLADGKFKVADENGDEILQEAKDYTDDAIAKIEHTAKLAVDAKPTYNAGVITYYVNGTEETTEDDNTWFFYDVDGVTYQTLFISGVEKTIQSGTIDDSNFLQKSDVASTYTGNEVDTSKIADLGALKALETILKSAINSHVAKTDIVDNLTSTDTDRPLSANQGRVLNEAISDKASSSDVYTKTEADATFISSTELNNHINDTVAHLTQAERDSLLTEDKITKLVESTSTDEEVPSAKAVFTLSEKKLEKTSVVTTIDENSDDNHVPTALAAYNEFEKKVDKTSIVTSIDSTSTDEQVISAKATYDEFAKHQIIEYAVTTSDSDKLANIGIADISTITSLLDITKNLGDGKRIVLQVNNSDKTTLYSNGVIPIDESGILIITWERARGVAYYTTDNALIFMTTTTNAITTEWRDWKRLNPNSLIYTNNDKSAIDFDSYTTSGTYYIEYNTGHSNAPTAYNGWLQVFATETAMGVSNKYIKQVLYRFGTVNKNCQETYERMYNGSTWSNWTRITDVSNLKLLDASYINKLGLTTDSDSKYALSDIFNALPENSITLFDNAIVSTSDLPFSGALGTFEISKIGTHRTKTQFTVKAQTPRVYNMGINDNGGLSGIWVQQCTTTSLQTSNKGVTKFTAFDDETNYKPHDHTRYYVMGGTCFVNIDVTVVSPTTSATTILTDLPKSVSGIYLTIPAFSQAGKVPLTVSASAGSVSLMYGEAGCRYLSSFSYAVAD
ncbi:MAG: pyocin knob domain-containing protein, partial [Lachnospira sp.]